MQNENLLSYIRSQKWFLGVRADASLLFYSAKQDGVRRYVKDLHGLDFAETMLVPVGGQPVRAINVGQAKAFHEVSRKIILENPKLLEERIKENDKTWVRIARACEVLDRAVKAREMSTAITEYKRVAESYAETGAQFIVIFSLGLKLTEAGVNAATEQALRTHDVWRNTVALKEELMGECWYDFFTFMAAERKLKTSALDLMRYLSLTEVLAWLDGKDLDVDATVATRMWQGFAYLDLRESRSVVDDADTIKTIGEIIAHSEAEKKNADVISGQAAYTDGKIIKGEVIVIMTKDELGAKSKFLAGKILVTQQTTPHFIPYLKGVKAILTDEGGITCHAAIISRELKIPCIVGTKSATQILNDGDEVEVDADEGVVRILKKI
ncbi:MAG: PEP-utilizing enzyme [Patescibacteria group bacterium]